jgi:hypothetical protein
MTRCHRETTRAIGAALLAVVMVAGCSAGVIDAVDLDPHALQEGLIAHWTFDDGAGATTLTDSTANHYDGTLMAGATFRPGEHFGGTLHFDGTDQSEVQVPLFPQPSASWSVAGWVRAPAGDTSRDVYATIASTEVPVTPTGPGAGGWQLNLRLGTPTNPNNNKSLYQYAYWTGPMDGDYSFEECECFVPDEWAHIAGVFDADSQTISLYHNGTFVGSKTPEPNIIPGSNILYFGRWGYDSSSRRLIGDLDDFVIYNRALTLPEIRQLARAPLPTTP